MAYFDVLALFVLPPLIGLALLAWRGGRRRPVPAWGLLRGRAYWAVLLHVAIAVLYTTPWDNYLVATGVWWYNPALVTGITLGWVPIEEYVFFVLQTLLSGVLLLVLMRTRLVAGPVARPLPRLRRASVAVTGLIWLAAVVALLAGWKPVTYLGLELGWALAPVMSQLAFGADILWARRKLVATAVLLPSAYLALADAVAIQSGTWTIDPAQSSGVLVAGVLPIEEVTFFMLTNVLVVCGMVLLLAPESQARTYALLDRLRRVQKPVIGLGQREEA